MSEGKTPQAIFYSNDTDESRIAREVLIQAGVYFEEVEKLGYVNGSLNGYKPPLVRAREGEFEGVERIKTFVSFVQSSPK